MDHELLRYYIAIGGHELSEIQVGLGLSRSALFRKLSGVTEFKRNEIKYLIDKLNLTEDTVIKIFFLD